jgi:hypothetical protein
MISTLLIFCCCIDSYPVWAPYNVRVARSGDAASCQISYNSFVSLTAASTVDSRDLGNVAAHSLIPFIVELAASLKLLADSSRTSLLLLDGVVCRTMGTCFRFETTAM